MSMQITGSRWGTDASDDIITGQTRIAADPTTQLAQDSMAQLVRQGQDTSLRSLQVWADLARRFGSTAASSSAGSTMFSLAHDPFEKLLEAQRQVVDELVATQRELARHIVDATAAFGDNPHR
ncbi:MAG: hypothetical protein ACRDS0_19780 [Pseudonocardiaceae bacterium]